MKKIISIILAIIAIFAMSVNAFAATDTFVKNEPDYIVTVDANACPELNKSETSETGEIYYKGYKFEVEVSNFTDSNVKAEDFKLSVNAYNSETKAPYVISAVAITTDVNEDGTDDGTAYASNKGNGKYVVYARVNCSSAIDLYFTIAINDEPIQTVTHFDTNKVEAKFELVKEVATPNEPTTETTTEAPTESKPADTTTTTKPADTTTEKAPADVDDTIPDTGATVPFAAIGTLVTSAITALVAKKKKEN
jgi:hypothetical protein